MPIRSVPQRSDRGKIKDLSKDLLLDNDEPPTPYEIRLKKLYEFSETYNNKELQSSLGFITTNYISDKNALPLSVYRIRQLVNEIKSKSPDTINQLSQQIGRYIQDGISVYAMAYLAKKTLIKTASIKPRLFWRASK